ncbi:MAG: potassium-transporting ATPase subunit KdpA [Chitinispirillia bacterium]|nr:potassium-transporting ATPase subunit KdpA [Chitinispirillia bacterium]
MLYILLNMAIFTALVIPMGRYLYKIADNQKTFADPLFNRIDNAVYKICGIDRRDMDWKKYLAALLLTNAVMIFIGYPLLRLQGALFLNPNGIANMPPALSLNTVISFMTNTDLQHYSGESGLSYFSQMIVITMMMFTSAATGYAACMAMIRGFCGKQMGNYFVDMIRITTRALIPLSIILGLIFISQGSPQTLAPNATVTTIEGTRQDLPLGPIASLVSIKNIGTNGGGFLGANSSTPFENPNIFTNMIQMFSMMIMPGACVIAFGLMFHYARRHQKKTNSTGDDDNTPNEKTPLFGDEGRTVFIAMSILFVIGQFVCFFAESSGNQVLGRLGINVSTGSFEGKEVRFGIAPSAMFTTAATASAAGSVNNMHDTLTPIGGMVALLNMMLNTVFSGIGTGLMNMLLYVLIAVFLCGLMIGRTPEYLGKKIESKEIKLAVLSVILHPLLILGFTAIALSTNGGLAGITNPGYHGLTQVLYEYSSAAANNGSGFQGLANNSNFWNITTGLAMFFGRYLSIILQIAIAGSLLSKNSVNETVGTLKTGTVTFGVITAAVVLIFSALTFFPAIALGPVAEYLTLGR